LLVESIYGYLRPDLADDDLSGTQAMFVFVRHPSPVPEIITDTINYPLV